MLTKNELEGKLMVLEITMLSEINQAQKAKYVEPRPKRMMVVMMITMDMNICEGLTL
jgi:hypothetical protein